MSHREISADIPLAPGDQITQAALRHFPGFPVTGPDRETRVGHVVTARPGSGGIEVTIALDEGVGLDVDDVGDMSEAQHPLRGWLFVHPRPAVDDAPGPFAAAVNPWQRDQPCTECGEPGTRLLRVRTDLPVYAPEAYDLRCQRHG